MTKRLGPRNGPFFLKMQRPHVRGGRNEERVRRRGSGSGRTGSRTGKATASSRPRVRELRSTLRECQYGRTLIDSVAERREEEEAEVRLYGICWAIRFVKLFTCQGWRGGPGGVSGLVVATRGAWIRD